MSTVAAALYPIGDSKAGNEATANVVFVHGLGGHYQTTWQSDLANQDTLLPKWMYDDLNNTELRVNVWSLAYPADAFRVLFFSKQPHDDSVPQRARNLMNILISQQITERPVLIIAHSLGGVIAKQMLRSSFDAQHLQEGTSSNWRSVPDLYSFSPHLIRDRQWPTWPVTF